MKRVLLMLLMVSACGFAVAQDRIQWMRFEDAIAACEKKPKKIFVDVYTDWCGWCKRMDQTTFLNAAVVKYMNENFYAVKFDAEYRDTVVFQGYPFVYVPGPNGGRGAHQLAAAMLQNRLSYPSYVIFNEEQKLLQVIPGYQEAQSFLPLLHYFGEDAFKNTSWADFQQAFSARGNQ